MNDNNTGEQKSRKADNAAHASRSLPIRFSTPRLSEEIILDKGKFVSNANETTEPYSSLTISAKQQRRSFRELPLYKLSVGLSKTYQRIDEHNHKTNNQTAVEPKSKEVILPQWDGSGYHYVVRQNEFLEKYKIEGRIGKGSFGQVISSFDGELPVAIKIIKSGEEFTTQAQTEIAILESLDSPYIVKLLKTFYFQNHQCLVFEKLDVNLYELLKRTEFKGVSLRLIHNFGTQLLQALSYLEEKNIIHCDLKPENILLVNKTRAQLKLIDFGSSCTVTDRPYTYIQTRFYRAPEIILGCDYSCAIDMFSLGCTLLEMHTGKALFPGKNEAEQMYLLCNSRGLPPDDMLQRGKKTSQFFAYSNEKYTLKPLHLPSKPSKPLTIDEALGINESPDLNTTFKRLKNTESMESYKEFSSFLNDALNYSPDKRITPVKSLKHKFFLPHA